jgi:hypothetical protein
MEVTTTLRTDRDLLDFLRGVPEAEELSLADYHWAIDLLQQRLARAAAEDVQYLEMVERCEQLASRCKLLEKLLTRSRLTSHWLRDRVAEAEGQVELFQQERVTRWT